MFQTQLQLNKEKHKLFGRQYVATEKDYVSLDFPPNIDAALPYVFDIQGSAVVTEVWNYSLGRLNSAYDDS